MTAADRDPAALPAGLRERVMTASLLAREARHNPMIDEASDQLSDLRDTLSLTPGTRTPAASLLTVMSSGFLPGHPVVRTPNSSCEGKNSIMVGAGSSVIWK